MAATSAATVYAAVCLTRPSINIGILADNADEIAKLCLPQGAFGNHHTFRNGTIGDWDVPLADYSSKTNGKIHSRFIIEISVNEQNYWTGAMRPHDQLFSREATCPISAAQFGSLSTYALP